MFGNKLTSREVVVRNGKSYERKHFISSKGELSFRENEVTKQTYDLPIAKAQAELEMLQSLQSDAIDPTVE